MYASSKRMKAELHGKITQDLAKQNHAEKMTKKIAAIQIRLVLRRSDVGLESVFQRLLGIKKESDRANELLSLLYAIETGNSVPMWASGNSTMPNDAPASIAIRFQLGARDFGLHGVIEKLRQETDKSSFIKRMILTAILSPADKPPQATPARTAASTLADERPSSSTKEPSQFQAHQMVGTTEAAKEPAPTNVSSKSPAFKENMRKAAAMLSF